MNKDVVRIVQGFGRDDDFYYLCRRLEKFQHSLIPQLAKEGYHIADDLYGIKFFVLYVGACLRAATMPYRVLQFAF